MISDMLTELTSVLKEAVRIRSWKMFKNAFWCATPIKCCWCSKWFLRGDFWNPWGPGNGPGLACSPECCYKANPPSETYEQWIDRMP